MQSNQIALKYVIEIFFETCTWNNIVFADSLNFKPSNSF